MSVRFALLCPIDPAHGRLLDAPTATHGFFCPHAAHGGNGYFFTTDEAEGRATPRRERVIPAERTPRVEPDLALTGSPGQRGDASGVGLSPGPTPGNQPIATQPRPATALAVDAGGDQQLLGTASG